MVIAALQVCPSLHIGVNSRTANWTTLSEILIISSNILSTLSKDSTTVECTVYYLVKQQSIAASNQIANCTLTMLYSWGF